MSEVLKAAFAAKNAKGMIQVASGADITVIDMSSVGVFIIKNRILPIFCAAFGL
jgi:hypothetical protein